MMALLSGLIMGLAFPTSLAGYRLPDLGWMAWVGLVPLFCTLQHATVWQGIKRGFIFGIGVYGVTLYWIYIALHHYGEIHVVGSVAGWMGAVVIVSGLTAVPCGMAVWLQHRKFPLFLTLPLCWMAHDFLRNFFPFGGFPWSSLAYTQGHYLYLIQSLDLFGVYGLTFLIVLVNGCLASGKLPYGSRRTALVALAMILFVLNLTYGFFRVRQVDAVTARLPHKKLALIQGNIPQDEKWQEELGDVVLRRYLEESLKAELQKPELLLWPEAAYPSVIPLEQKVSLRTLHLDELKTPLLMGVVTYTGISPDIVFSLFNSALLIRPQQGIGPIYHKHHLVPFGEYVPLSGVLYFLEKLVPGISGFVPGTDWNLPDGIGVTICYEDIFPEISRTLVRRGADFLVNLTNDAWYDQASMAFQHLDYSRYRAVENRRAMARATNTGVTAVVDPAGRIIATLAPFTPGVLQAEVTLGGPNSFYDRVGDWFAWSCLVVFCLLVVYRLYLPSPS